MLTPPAPRARTSRPWLRAPPGGVWRFGEEYRPVTLWTTTLGYDPAKNDFLFERKLTDRLYDVVLQHFDNKPTLVFCNSRDGAMQAAKELAQRASSTSSAAAGLTAFVTSHDQRQRLLEASQRAVNNQLRQTIQQAGPSVLCKIDIDIDNIESFIYQIEQRVYIICTMLFLHFILPAGHGVPLQRAGVLRPRAV